MADQEEVKKNSGVEEKSPTNEEKSEEGGEIEQDNKAKGKGTEEKPRLRLTPEEQDIAYELKAQVFRNIEAQNQKIKTELALHIKQQELKEARKTNRSLQQEASLSRTNALKLMHMFERKAKEANEKLREMQKELEKSQVIANKYKELYDQEVSTKTGAPAPKSTHDSVTAVRASEVAKRNEILVTENENLKLEIQRLKSDNTDLVKKVKHAEQKSHNSEAALSVSDSARKDLQKRLEKEKERYQLLNKSITKQTSDWIHTKKQLQNLEEELRWTQVGPVSTNAHAAEQRFHSQPVTRNVYLPRKMLPAEQWAGK